MKQLLASLGILLVIGSMNAGKLEGLNLFKVIKEGKQGKDGQEVVDISKLPIVFDPRL